MSGYVILVEEAGFAAEKEPESGNGRTPEERSGRGRRTDFVDAWDARERYAIPSAFSAYAGYLKRNLIKIKKDKKVCKEGAGALQPALI